MKQNSRRHNTVRPRKSHEQNIRTLFLDRNCRGGVAGSMPDLFLEAFDIFYKKFTE